MAQKYQNATVSCYSETQYHDSCGGVGVSGGSGSLAANRFGVGKQPDSRNRSNAPAKQQRLAVAVCSGGNCPARAAVKEQRDTVSASKGDASPAPPPPTTPNMPVEQARPRQRTTSKTRATPPAVVAPSSSWHRTLRARTSSETVSGFSKFDPLHTLHFLGKELRSQLAQIAPNDSSVYDVLSEMQATLKRIPADCQVIADAAIRKHAIGSDVKSASGEQVQPVMKCEGCQTPHLWYMEPARLQAHLEESSEKIEKACQQMEALCAKLKSEKEALEVQLGIERESAKLQQAQIDDYKAKYIASTALAESLKAKNSDLSLDVQKLHLQLEAAESPSAQQLKSFIQNLQRAKLEAEADSASFERQMHHAQLERDKLEAILAARDMQVKEIRYEMTQLQEVVNAQLLDFQNNVTSTEDMTQSHNTNTLATLATVGEEIPTTSREHLEELLNSEVLRLSEDGGQPRKSVDSLQNTDANEQDDALIAASCGTLNRRHVYKIPADDKFSGNALSSLVCMPYNHRHYHDGGDDVDDDDDDYVTQAVATTAREEHDN